MERLQYVVQNCPVIDNHAHNLLQQLDSSDFLTITTEAEGEALKDTRTSLPHLRAARQLKELYGIQSEDWNAIEQARRSCISRDSKKLIRKCLEGTYTILMDDGLDKSRVHVYSWHDQFVTKPVKRIVRIEAVAADIMHDMIVPDYKAASGHDQNGSTLMTDVFRSLTRALRQEFQNAIKDPAVAGFKSVIAYRTGLSIGQVDVDAPADDVVSAFEQYLQSGISRDNFRVQLKPLNDWLVRLLLHELRATSQNGADAKPLQFHTGLGDNDINLLLADPSHLQPLIEEYPSVPFIILHSSYPFTRSAGYLATVYSNAYLDLGEVFPMVSRDGQETIIRQALEIVPGSKLLWSTDGHHWPETYWLGNKQFRQALEKVLVEYVNYGDLNAEQAVQLATDMLFNNANRVYHLGFEEPDLASPLPPSSKGTITHSPLLQNASGNSPTPSSYDLSLWKSFEAQNPAPAYIYVYWLDRMAQLRNRVLPVKEFRRIIETGGQLSISRGNTGTLQNDGPTKVMNPVGQIFVRPDLESLRPTHPYDTLRKTAPDGKHTTSCTLLASWTDEDGQPLEYCHRSRVQQLVADIKRDFGVNFLIGFEIEITFLYRAEDGKSYTPYVQNQAWGTLSPEQWEKMSFFGEILDALATMGIDMQQFHAESAQGQYEFVLPPLPPVAAIDTLIQTRIAIQQLAHRHGLRATLHPSPFPGIGTAAHAHISLTPPDLSHAFFAGGVLEHIKAICAFTQSEQVSYARVIDDGWTGGTWVCWGTQNREAPLRYVKDGRWEVRCLDGMANMYLAIGAILAAGLIGMRKGGQGGIQDCRVNPSKLSDDQRTELGITEKLSTKLDDSLLALRADKSLSDVLGEEMVHDYLIMKEAEQKMLMAMPEDERRAWFIEHY